MCTELETYGKGVEAGHAIRSHRQGAGLFCQVRMLYREPDRMNNTASIKDISTCVRSAEFYNESRIYRTPCIRIVFTTNSSDIGVLV